jgi:hypothetical protein
LLKNDLTVNGTQAYSDVLRIKALPRDNTGLRFLLDAAWNAERLSALNNAEATMQSNIEPVRRTRR